MEKTNYSMKYFEFFKMLEKKDHIINKMNLTDEQKRIAIEFFTKHPNYESEIKNWQDPKLSWANLEAVINKPRNTKSQLKKRIRKGLESLKENVHYKVIYEDADNVFYQPLCYVAARILASNSVPPSVAHIKDQAGQPLSGAKWCISYQKERDYWDDYTFEREKVFLFHFNRVTKYAMEISMYVDEDYEDMASIDPYYYLYKREVRVWDVLDEDMSSYIYYKKASKESPMPDLRFITSLWDKAAENYEYIKQYHDEDVAYTKELERQALEAKKVEFFKDVEKKKKTSEPLILEHDIDTQFAIDYGLIENGELIVQFDEVIGNVKLFDAGLTSLKNSPKKVHGHFSCGGNPIKSFEGSPEEIGGVFYATRCDLYIPNLKGITQKVGKGYHFTASNIGSLEGLPEKIEGPLALVGTSIKSFKGGPKEFTNQRPVEREMLCRDCKELESLEGLPKNTRGLDVSGCEKLKSLESLPSTVESLNISGCSKITSLKGCPNKMSLLTARDTRLTTLKYIPEEVQLLDLSHYDSYSQLKDIDYWPKKVYIANITNAVSMENVDYYGVIDDWKAFEERYPFIDYTTCEFHKGKW